MDTQRAIHWISLSVRWAGRVTGLLLAALVVAVAVGEGGPPNVLRQPPAVRLEFLAMFLMLTGFLVGWRRELLGGGLAVGGFVLFFGTEIVANGKPPGGAMLLFVIPGVLLLLSYTLNRQQPFRHSG